MEDDQILLNLISELKTKDRETQIRVLQAAAAFFGLTEDLK